MRVLLSIHGGRPGKRWHKCPDGENDSRTRELTFLQCGALTNHCGSNATPPLPARAKAISERAALIEILPALLISVRERYYYSLLSNRSG